MDSFVEETGSSPSERRSALARLGPDERYTRDQDFRTLVDMLESLVGRGEYTPTEVREAALLAAIHYESRHVRPLIMVGGSVCGFVRTAFVCLDCDHSWAGPPLGDVQDRHLTCPKCGGRGM